jgi:tetratricopeptide (TPR) repeat protein
MEYVEKAIEINPTYIDALILAGTISQSIGEINQEYASSYFSRAQDLYKIKRDTMSNEYAMLQIQRGELFEKTGSFDSAIRIYQNALIILEKLGLQNSFDYFNVTRKTFNLLIERGDYAQAFIFRLKAKNALEDRREKKSSAYFECLTDLCLISWKQNRIPTALDYLLKAKPLYQFGFLNSESFDNLFWKLFSHDQFPDSLCWVEQRFMVLDHGGKYPSWEESQLLHLNQILCQFYCETGNLIHAQELLSKIKVQSDSLTLQNSFSLFVFGNLSYSVGLLHLKNKDTKNALKCFNNAADIFSRVKYNGLLLDKTRSQVSKLSGK